METNGNLKYQDKALNCAECGSDFLFEVGEQNFFAIKGYPDPRRCPECRKARKELLATLNGEVR